MELNAALSDLCEPQQVAAPEVPTESAAETKGAESNEDSTEETNAEPAVEIAQNVENVAEESSAVDEIAEPETCLNVEQNEESNSVAENVEKAKEASPVELDEDVA